MQDIKASSSMTTPFTPKYNGLLLDRYQRAYCDWRVDCDTPTSPARVLTCYPSSANFLMMLLAIRNQGGVYVIDFPKSFRPLSFISLYCHFCINLNQQTNCVNWSGRALAFTFVQKNSEQLRPSSVFFCMSRNYQFWGPYISSVASLY